MVRISQKKSFKKVDVKTHYSIELVVEVAKYGLANAVIGVEQRAQF